MGTKWRMCNGNGRVPVNGAVPGKGRKCCVEYGLFQCSVQLWQPMELQLSDITGVNNCWAGYVGALPWGLSGPAFSGSSVIIPVFLEQEGADLYIKTIPAPLSKAHFRAKYYTIVNQPASGGYNNRMYFVVEELGHADYNDGEISYYEHVGDGQVVLTSGPYQRISCQNMGNCIPGIGSLYQPGVARPFGQLGSSTATLVGYTAGPDNTGPVLEYSFVEGVGTATYDGWTFGAQWARKVEFPNCVFALPGSRYSGNPYYPSYNSVFLGRHSHPLFYSYGITMPTQITGLRDRQVWLQSEFNDTFGIPGPAGALNPDEWSAVSLSV